MRTLLISLGWATGTLLAIIVWRRLVLAPMPRVFDFILNTKFRKRLVPRPPQSVMVLHQGCVCSRWAPQVVTSPPPPRRRSSRVAD